MSKEVVALVHNGILLSYKKECISFCSNEVDEPGHRKNGRDYEHSCNHDLASRNLVLILTARRVDPKSLTAVSGILCGTQWALT